MASHFSSVASIHFNSIFRVSSVYSLLSISHIYQICCLSGVLAFLFLFHRDTVVYSPTSIFYISQICRPFFLFFSLLLIPLIMVSIVISLLPLSHVLFQLSVLIFFFFLSFFFILTRVFTVYISNRKKLCRTGTLTIKKRIY